MMFLTIRYTIASIPLLLLAALVYPTGAASTDSGIARSSLNNRSIGLPDDLTPGLFERQVTTPPPAITTPPPAAPPTTPPPAITTPPPAAPPESPPASSSTTTIITPDVPTGNNTGPVTSPVTGPVSAPSPNASGGNGNVSTTVTDPLVTGGPGVASPTPLNTPSQNGTVTDALTGPGVASHTPLNTPSQNGTQNGTGIAAPSSTVSYSVSYQYATVTGPGGSESISIGTFSISEAVVPVTTDPAIAAAPLVVQQAAPDAPPTPACSLQYLPEDVWQSSGTSGNTTTSTGGPSPHPAIVSQCNNGTRVSNRVGAQIHLKFTGTDVSLLMVPGVLGGPYDVKIDDEDPETHDNYKPDATSCEVSTPWNRTGLTNEPHVITVTIKGSPAGSAGGSQIEFNGIIFKGPKTTTDSSGPNWIIIGASIGAGVVVIALLFILVLCIRRRRRAQSAVTPTPIPRPPSAVSSFRPQTLVSGHGRTDSNFSGAAQTGHYRADSNFSNAPSGHYRGDSGFSGTPYSPTSPLQALQQNPFGHSRQQSDAPLMMHQAQQAPWQVPPGAMVNVPSGSPYHSNMSSPQSRPTTLVGYTNGHDRPPGAGYGNGQERQSFAQSHGRATSYGSDGKNPFE